MTHRNEAVIAEVLLAMSVHPSLIPVNRAGRAALYRQLTVDKRVLIVVDGITSESQVRDLLPVRAGSLVICTSRSRLSGLRPDLSMFVEPGILEADDAVRLIAERCGGRVSAEDPAAREIARLYGRTRISSATRHGADGSSPHWRPSRSHILLGRSPADARMRRGCQLSRGL